MSRAWRHSDPVQGFFFNRQITLTDLRQKIYPEIPIVSLRQIHKSKVINVIDPGISDGIEADALVTNLQNIGLTVHTADCLPLLAYESNVIGACHGGWRGVREGIINQWISKMISVGAIISKLKVAIGPTIGPCHFEVGLEIAEDLSRTEGKKLPLSWLKKINLPHWDLTKRFIDLETLAVFHLMQTGVLEENISRLSRCTFCYPEEYFSFRRDGAKNQRLEALIFNSQSK